MIDITPIFKHLAEKHGDFVWSDKRKSQLCNNKSAGLLKLTLKLLFF